MSLSKLKHPDRLPDDAWVPLWTAVSYALYGYALPTGEWGGNDIAPTSIFGRVQGQQESEDVEAEFNEKLNDAAFRGEVRFKGISLDPDGAKRGADGEIPTIHHTYFNQLRCFISRDSEIGRYCPLSVNAFDATFDPKQSEQETGFDWKEVLVEREGFLRWMCTTYPNPMDERDRDGFRWEVYEPDEREKIVNRFLEEPYANLAELDNAIERTNAELSLLGYVHLIHGPDKTDYNPMNKSQWRIPMALAWICWREAEWVTEFWEEYTDKCTRLRLREDKLGFIHASLEGRQKPYPWDFQDNFWRMANYTPHYISGVEAHEALFENLKAGTLTAFGTNEQREVIEIPAHHWSVLNFTDTVIERPNRASGGAYAYDDVFVMRVDILKLWPPKNLPAQEDKKTVVTRQLNPEIIDYWALAPVLAWIESQSFDKVREYFECSAYGMTDPDNSWVAGFIEASHKLWKAMSEGHLKASGIPYGSTVRRPIEPLEWLDLMLSLDWPDLKLELFNYRQSGERAYTDILWRREDVEREWPAPGNDAAVSLVEATPVLPGPKGPNLPNKPFQEKAAIEAYGLLVGHIQAIGSEVYTDEPFDVSVMKALFPDRTNHRPIVRDIRRGCHGDIVPRKWTQRGKKPSHMWKPENPDAVAAELKKKLKQIS